MISLVNSLRYASRYLELIDA